MKGQRLTSEQAAQLLARATAQGHPLGAAPGDHALESAPAAAEARGIALVPAPGGQAFQFEEHQDGSGI
jgi:hypothetical protein